MKIPLNKAACMSQLLMIVSTGHRYWISGEMDYAKAQNFSRKMAQLYPVEATSDQRAWAKKTARYSTHLILFPHDKDKTKVLYWLLATQGGAPKGFVDIHAREKMKDALAHPLTWRDQYECALKGRKGNSGKQSWTWSMQPAYFGRLKASVKEAADAGSVALADLFPRLSVMPMFGGIREQVGALGLHAQETWKKRRKSVCPDLLPNPLPIMPKIKVWGDLTLDILVEQMRVFELQRTSSGVSQAAEALAFADAN